MSKLSKGFHNVIKSGGFEEGAASEKSLLKQAKEANSGIETVAEVETIKILRAATEKVDDAFKTFDAAFCRMGKREADVEIVVKKHVAILKDKMNQVAEALARIEKLGGVDFEVKLQRLERFALAVETLDNLNKTGKLGSVAKAISGLT